MTLPRVLAIVAVLLFGSVIIAFFVKGIGNSRSAEVAISTESGSEPQSQSPLLPLQLSPPTEVSIDHKVVLPELQPPQQQPSVASEPAPSEIVQLAMPELLPEANRIAELFNTQGPCLPIVETLTYKSKTPWQKGRPAWVSDYARYYQTSRHFIARSLNGAPDYFKQEVSEGDKFNVLRKDKLIEFYLLVDLSLCKMWFFYDDLETKERVLLSTYTVGVGRVDSSKESGYLTPIGTYKLGNKIAIYKPKMMGNQQGQQVEMVRVFGTRWIPFDQEVGLCSAPAKGLGLHGLPLLPAASGELRQDVNSLGKYMSDGCIRLATEDIEELFAIIITRPTIVEIVKNFHDSHYRIHEGK